MQIIDHIGDQPCASERERRIIRTFFRHRARELRGRRGLRRYFAKLSIYLWAYQQAQPHIRKLRQEESHWI